MKTAEPIAIVGLGGVLPGAPDIASFWDNIRAKVDSIAEVPERCWDWRLYYDPDPAAPGKTYSKIGAVLPPFELDEADLALAKGVIGELDLAQKALLSAVGQALRDAGRKNAQLGERTALIVGSLARNYTDECLGLFAPLIEQQLGVVPAFGTLDTAVRRQILDGLRAQLTSRLPAITSHRYPGELVTGRVAKAFDLRGINLSVDASCASSIAAVDYAVKGLRSHEFDLAIAGGAEPALSPLSYIIASGIKALSPDGSRPFDAKANGFVMGEGAGVCVLKRLEDTRRDGDRVYGVIRSIGSSSDGAGGTLTAPKAPGQLLAAERAFQQLDYAPGEVGLLEAHATGTLLGDFVEARVGAEIFGPHAAKRSIGLGSVKSQIGHLRAAAGIASLIKAALALHHKTLPPTINVDAPTPNVDWENSPFFLVTEPRDWPVAKHPRRAHVNSHGFGGTNFHLALEEAR